MGSFVSALNRVNVVAVTTILVLHVGVIGHHVPCHYDFMFTRRAYHARLRARGVREALPPGRGVWGGFAPPGQQGVLGGCRPPTGGPGGLAPRAGGLRGPPKGVGVRKGVLRPPPLPPGVFFSSRTPSRIDVGVLGRAQTGNVQQSKYHFNPIARNQRISLSFGFDFRSNTPRGSADICCFTFLRVILGVPRRSHAMLRFCKFDFS